MISGGKFTDRVLGVALDGAYRPLLGVAYPPLAPHRVSHAQYHPRAPKTLPFRPMFFFNNSFFFPQKVHELKNDEKQASKRVLKSRTPFWNWVSSSRRRRSNSPDFLNLAFQ